MLTWTQYMNTSSSFIEEWIWSFWTLSGSNLLTYHLPLQQEIWLAVYSRSNLIGVTYIHLSLTHSLIHWPVHNIPNAPTKRYFFYKKNNSKMIPLVLLPWQQFCHWCCLNKTWNSQFSSQTKNHLPHPI